MRILVMSDSHRSVTTLFKVVEKLQNDISSFFFLGDNLDDIRDFEKRFPDIALFRIAGNCDFINPNDFALKKLCGKTIMYTHGHYFAVKSGTEALEQAAFERGASICLFGHTHEPAVFESKGVLFMNPGSISFPRGRYNYPTYGIINIDGKSVNAVVVGLTKHGERPVLPI